MKTNAKENGAEGATPTAPSEPLVPDASESLNHDRAQSQPRDVVELARELVESSEALEHLRRRRIGAAARLEVVALRERAMGEHLAELRAELARSLATPSRELH